MTRMKLLALVLPLSVSFCPTAVSHQEAFFPPGEDLCRGAVSSPTSLVLLTQECLLPWTWH